MSEKGIDQLRADLAAVDADCAEQIRKTVHDNYHHFIQACQVVATLLGHAMTAWKSMLEKVEQSWWSESCGPTPNHSVLSVL